MPSAASAFVVVVAAAVVGDLSAEASGFAVEQQTRLALHDWWPFAADFEPLPFVAVGETAVGEAALPVAVVLVVAEFAGVAAVVDLPWMNC